MARINYTTHKGANDLDTLRNIIADIEYLKAVGLNPWQGASSRRRMESRFTYTEDLTVNGKAVHVEIGTSVSCTYVRYSVTVTIDGIAQAKYTPALKKLVA